MSRVDLATPGPLRGLWLMVGLAVLYFLAGKVGLSFAVINSSASAVWPPTGIALAAFLLFGYRVWPAIFAGAFLVNLSTAGSFFTSIGIAGGNTLEGIVGAYLVGRYARGAGCFDSAKGIFEFVGLAAIFATTLSATIGVASLVLGGFADLANAPPIWLTWWLGDMAGALIVAPLIILWSLPPAFPWPKRRRPEAILLLLVVISIGTLCFAAPHISDYPLAFLCLPPLVWVAFRFGPREVATAVALLAVMAVWATERGMGPFVMATRNESLLVLQSFMATLSMMMLPLAALVMEHTRSVTECRKMGAEERRARAEAEAATRAKDEFLAMLSHELRNPLQAVSFSMLLLQHRRGGDDVSQRAFGIMQRQVDQLAHLVNQLLDVARVVSGKVSVAPQRINLEEAIRQCLAGLASGGKLDRHTVDVRAEPIWLEVDPVRLEQVLHNLLSNSLKFTPAGGTIRVSAQRQGEDAVIRVSDTGIGIPGRLLPRVFDLFTQGDRDLDRREGGLGVGLTLVRRLVELHGGTVEALSAGEGRGSEFVVRMPCSQAAPQPLRDLTAQEGERRRVLIVEDNADARESLRVLLEIAGHEVFEAADGTTGIEAALKLRPDVVLIDIGLPRADGYEVARTLRAREADLGARWRLVAVTGYGRPEDRRRCREAGFDEHLVKPVDPADLHRALHAGTKAAATI